MARTAIRRSIRIAWSVDAQGQNLLQWVLTNGDERNKLASYAANNGNTGTRGVEVAIGEIFEMRVPFDVIGAQHGSRIRLRFAVWRDQLPADSLPVEGWIDLYALTEEELETQRAYLRAKSKSEVVAAMRRYFPLTGRSQI